MAKIKGEPPQSIMTQTIGIVSWRHTKYGVVAAKWPRDRDTMMAAQTAAQVAVWDLQLTFLNYQEPEIFRVVRERTRNTGFYARDILIMCAYGNHVSWPGMGWSAWPPWHKQRVERP